MKGLKVRKFFGYKVTVFWNLTRAYWVTQKFRLDGKFSGFTAKENGENGQVIFMLQTKIS